MAIGDMWPRVARSSIICAHNTRGFSASSIYKTNVGNASQQC